MKLKWNVFYHNMNTQEITTFDIFKHGGFSEDVKKLLAEVNDKDEFAEGLRRELFYYFCNRSEYEIIIGPWCGGRNTRERKVDIYTQVMNNWDVFAEYVWKEGKTCETK